MSVKFNILITIGTALMLMLGEALVSPLFATNSDSTCNVDCNLNFVPFITTWKTDNPGASSNTSITIPTNGGGYNYDVDWNNDGVYDQFGITGNVTHDFGMAGIYTIRIKGDFPRIYFLASDDKEKILSIDQWGDIAWTDMSFAFYGASNLQYNATDAPDLTNVTDVKGMFQRASSFNGDLSNWDVSNVINMVNMFSEASSFNGDLSNWDVSNVTIIAGLFYQASSFNGDISNWDVSNVTVIDGIFREASAFNRDLSNWDVSGVSSMVQLFFRASSFNGDISTWDVSNVTNMQNMFYGASSFNGDLSSWDVSNVTNMQNMFYGASSFNGDLNNWDVSNVTDMMGMFVLASSFNGDLNNWDVSNVTNMDVMFLEASSFNGDISNWDVSNVTNMVFMFRKALSFNGDISSWDVSNVTNIAGMFYQASAFDRDLSSWDVSGVSSMVQLFFLASSFNNDLSSWDVSNVTNMWGMLDGSGMDVMNYDQTLIGWATQSVQSGVGLTAVNLVYCLAENARNILINNYGWNFIGDNLDCSAYNSPPIAICQNLTLATDANCEVTVAATQFDGGSIDPDLDVLNFSINPTGPFTVGQTGLVLTVSDGLLTSSCTASITVFDNTPPDARCKNATIEIDPSETATLALMDMDDGSLDPNGCGIASMTLSKSSFTCDELGDHIVFLEVTDNNTLSNSCSATVTITDPNTYCCDPPVALCKDATTQLNQDGNVSFNFSDIDNGSIIDCTLSGSEITNTALHCAEIGPNVVTLILTDINNSTSSCTATVTVEDNIKPTISCPTGFTQNNDLGLCGATVSIPGPLAYDDNCGVDFLKARVRPVVDGVAGSWGSFQNDPSGYYEIGEYEVQWRAKDASNNKKNCKFNFEVVDAEAPNAVCLHPTITFNGENDIDLLGNDLFDAFASSDNCSAVSLVDFDKLFVLCEEVGSMETVTVTVQDEAGNTAQCTSNVTVSGLPCGWDGEPGGIDCTGGSQPTYDPNTSTYTLSGEGCNSSGYYSNSDAQAFMSTELCGDGEIIAEVTQVTGDGFAGIGMREDLSPGAKMIQLGIDGTLLTKREMRMTTGALAFNHLFQTQGKNWLKLSRAGSTFTAEHSSDGINWSLVIVSNIPMSNCLEVGMYVENAAATGAATGVFENVQINTISALVASDQGSTRQDLASSLKHATSIFVYPNPARELINIGLEGFADQAITITIYDKLGKAMKTVQKADYSNLENIQVNDLPGGAYFVEVQSSSYRHVQRLVLITD